LTKNEPPLFTVLSYLPWWISVISGLVVYVFLSYAFPAMVSENQILFMLTEASKNIAPFCGSLFLVPAIASIFMRKKRQKLLAQQKSIDTLKALSWQEFELLVGEAYRRLGYRVVENMTGGADGGIDLQLKKDDKTHIVQCKQWRKSKIGVSVVREMFGVLNASSAKSVFIVCSGHFTKEAIAFAADLPVQLIDGKAKKYDLKYADL
jgi:restriction system protein